jgi:hypothetical protein
MLAKQTRNVRAHAWARLRSEYAKQQRDHEHDEENVEQDLCNFGRARRDAGKSEHGRNDRNHEKDDRIVKHGDSSFLTVSVDTGDIEGN